MAKYRIELDVDIDVAGIPEHNEDQPMRLEQINEDLDDWDGDDLQNAFNNEILVVNDIRVTSAEPDGN